MIGLDTQSATNQGFVGPLVPPSASPRGAWAMARKLKAWRLDFNPRELGLVPGWGRRCFWALEVAWCMCYCDNKCPNTTLLKPLVHHNNWWLSDHGWSQLSCSHSPLRLQAREAASKEAKNMQIKRCKYHPNKYEKRLRNIIHSFTPNTLKKTNQLVFESGWLVQKMASNPGV